MYSNKSNSSNAVHPSPPLGRDQTTLLSRRPHEEPIQRIARGEHCKMSHYNLLPPRVPDPKIPIQYQLQFMNKVKNTTFTTDLVKDENGRPIKVAIYDTYTKPESVISPDNILSSAKVKLILLDAELCTVNWSPSEFVQNVLTERERKGPILTGRSLIIQLENGVGTFKNIVINDNSSWRKCGFRLAVMVECDGEEGYLNGERVQEAVSESFWVKDRRGKAFQKPDRLKLAHSVRYIKKIGKDRASLLQKEKIETVEDFLKRLKNNESDLRKILCIKSESNKEWESMVEHVMQCADEYHAKCTASNNSSQPQQALVDPMKRKMSHGTNGYHLVVDLGSSEPNPSENNIIEGFPQSKLSFDLLLPSHSSWGPHSALAPNKSFLCASGGDSSNYGNGGNYGGGGGGGGSYVGCGGSNYGGSGGGCGNYGGSGGGSGSGGGNYGGDGDGSGNYGGSGGLPQPELSFNPLLPSHSSWGGHATLAPKKSFLCAGGGGGVGGNYGGGRDGSGNYSGSGGGNYSSSCGFTQSELSFDPLFPNHWFWGAHAASNSNYNKSFLCAGGGEGGNFGGSGGGGGNYGGGGDGSGNYGGSGEFFQSGLSFDPLFPSHLSWGVHAASSSNYNKSFLCAGGDEGDNFGGSGGGGGNYSGSSDGGGNYGGGGCDGGSGNYGGSGDGAANYYN